MIISAGGPDPLEYLSAALCNGNCLESEVA